jgi:hypothetical protein
LCDNKADAVVVISKQVFVAKEEPGTERCSDYAEFGKDWLHRGVKRPARQRLEIKPKAGPGILLPPFPD